MTVPLLSTLICAGALTLQRAVYPLILLAGFLWALRGLSKPQRAMTFVVFTRAVTDVSRNPKRGSARPVTRTSSSRARR